MSIESQLTPQLFKNTVQIKLSSEATVNLNKKLKELDMNPSQYFMYLIEEHEGDHLTSLHNFRYNLKRRVKKGINFMYLQELIKLRDYLNILINRL
jgi:hypothetical protein